MPAPAAGPRPAGPGPAARRRPGPRPTADEVREALRAVIDPELGDDIVDLGHGARTSGWRPDGAVAVEVALTIAGCPLRAQIERDVRGRLGGVPGVTVGRPRDRRDGRRRAGGR